MNTIVTVIIPVYNSYDCLDRCLFSVVNQTFYDIDIVVIDDGSTDGSISIVNKYIKDDDRLILISQPNKGLGAARNAGILTSRGRYIVFVDSDDEINLNMIEAMYNHALLSSSDVVGCRYERIENDGSIDRVSLFEGLSGDRLKGYLNGDLSPMVCNKIYEKKLFIDNNILFNERIYHEDQIAMLKILFFSKKTSYLNNVYYKWHVNEKTISTTITVKHVDDIFYVISEIKEFLILYGLYQQYTDYFIIKSVKLINCYILSLLLKPDFICEKNKSLVNCFTNHLLGSDVFERNMLFLLKERNNGCFFQFIFSLSLLNKKTENFLLDKYISTSFTKKEVGRCLLVLDSIEEGNEIELLVNNVKKSGFERVLIYGAGKVLEVMYPYLLEMGIEVIGLVDRQALEVKKECLGFMVQTLEEVYSGEVVGLPVVVASFSFVTDITRKIQSFAREQNIEIPIISILSVS